MKNLFSIKYLVVALMMLFASATFAQGSGIINLTGTQAANYLNTHPTYGSISLTSSISKKAYNPATGLSFKYDNTRSTGDKWVEYANSGNVYTWSTTAPSSNVGNLVLLSNGSATTTQTTVTTSNGIVLGGAANNWTITFDPSAVSYTTVTVPAFKSVEDATISAGKQWRASSDNVMGVPVGSLFIKSPIVFFLSKARLDILHRFKFLN